MDYLSSLCLTVLWGAGEQLGNCFDSQGENTHEYSSNSTPKHISERNYWNHIGFYYGNSFR